MRNENIDKILSIIDNLFGEDDNSPIPTPMEMHNSGIGDAHEMRTPIYGCEQVVEPMRTDLEILHEKLAELFEWGAEIYRERTAYETELEWKEALFDIDTESNFIRKEIADLCGNYVARFETNDTTCMTCYVDYSFHTIH